MKLIILAAGIGSRLRPLTDKKPKCMVEYQQKAIIDSILDTSKNCGLNDIAIVTGYQCETLRTYLKDEVLSFFHNDNYENTNMVSTLFCAQGFMNDDILISYADIIYDQEILRKLMNFEGDMGVVVDRGWRELWEKRMADPLTDAESLKIENNYIVELGKKTVSYDDIQGQYIGLIKISNKILKNVINFYKKLDRNILYDGNNYDNMYMTSFIQLLIDNNIVRVAPVLIEGGWIEIDEITDLDVMI